MAEATNDLAFMVTGAYGKPVAKQMGAPLRLHLPWKYGFKSIKSVVKVTFTDKRPKGLWEALQAREYGFWANVNPEVAHPRWSQATEEVIGQVAYEACDVAIAEDAWHLAHEDGGVAEAFENQPQLRPLLGAGEQARGLGFAEIDHLRQ